MRKLAFIVLIAVIGGCDPTVVFMEPQPQGKKDLASFPSKFLGTYMQLDDSSIYIIYRNCILEKYEEDLADPEAEIIEDEDIELIGERLLFKEMNLEFPVRRRNDSVFGHIVIYDTIVNLKGSSKLRKLGRNYILNQPSDSLWLVFKLSFDKSGYVYLCDIDHEQEMGIFEQYTSVETEKNDQGNPMKYYLSPALKELKTILKLETFTDTTGYIRISQDFLR
ncbi:hypothetical protein ACFLSP_00330 [Bacteroidota bacterium]